MTRLRRLSALQLKLLMTILMTLDHLWYFLPDMPYWFHPVSRVVMPVFCFLTAQGLVHTRDRQAYIARLFLFGVATFAGNLLLTWIFAVEIRNSILLTLALAAQTVETLERGRTEGQSAGGVLLVCLLLASSWFFEGMLLVPVSVLIFYYLRERPLLMCVAFVIASPPVLYLVRIDDPAQWLMLLAVIPILLYNGKRGMPGGSGGALKYAFYAYYPLHIWVLYLIARFVF